ncbi:MAG: hypothetical protein JW867_02330, partial [Candidatus Omnitrophica bacterium]|nr:hypothetical protein [Candidatus Omnitrophota bacterium]
IEAGFRLRKEFFMKRIIFLSHFFAFIGLSVYSQESLTLSTYYPAPFGVYSELRSKRLAIGEEYYKPVEYCWAPGSCTNEISDDTDLVVEGNVGIGTSDTQGRMMRVYALEHKSAIFIDEIGSVDAGPDVFFRKARNDGAGNPSVVEIGDSLGGVGYGGYVNGAFTKDAAAIGGRVESLSGSKVRAAITFTTRDSNDSWAERARISSNGDVGIGVVTPQSKLDVDGGVKISDVTDNCGPDKAGTMRYNNDRMQYCNGSDWIEFGGANTPVYASMCVPGAPSNDGNNTVLTLQSTCLATWANDCNWDALPQQARNNCRNVGCHKQSGWDTMTVQCNNPLLGYISFRAE